MLKEIWDAYDRDGIKLEFDLIRGEPIPEGVYHIVAEIYAITKKTPPNVRINLSFRGV